MKTLRIITLLFTYSLLISCSSVTGTRSEHDSVLFTHFVKDEGEISFCIAAPDQNPYPPVAEPGYIDFHDNEWEMLVFKYYDPTHYGPGRNYPRLRLVVTIRKLPNYSRENPLLLENLWEGYFSEDESNIGYKRYGEHSIEQFDTGPWLRREMLATDAGPLEPGGLSTPGVRYDSVIWGRYIFSVSMVDGEDRSDSMAYIQERSWLIEKIINTLRASKTVDEDVIADCDDF